MTYAINITDMLWPDRLALMQLVVRPFFPKDLDKAHIVQVDSKRVDEIAIVLECSDEQAEAIIQLIRCRCERNEWRCYYSQTGRGDWRRV